MNVKRRKITVTRMQAVVTRKVPLDVLAILVILEMDLSVKVHIYFKMDIFIFCLKLSHPGIQFSKVVKQLLSNGRSQK